MRKILFASLLLVATAAFAGDFSYLFGRDGNSTISANVGDVRRIVKLHERWGPGRYIWTRIGSREYVIRDAATLSEADAAFSEADAFHREVRQLRQRMRPLERKQDELERQIDRIHDRHSDADVPIDESRLAELEQRLKAVERELRGFEKEEERLDRRQEALSGIAEKKLRTIVERAVSRGVAERVD